MNSSREVGNVEMTGEVCDMADIEVGRRRGVCGSWVWVLGLVSAIGGFFFFVSNLVSVVCLDGGLMLLVDA